jgi:hypothetical protein
MKVALSFALMSVLVTGCSYSIGMRGKYVDTGRPFQGSIANGMADFDERVGCLAKFDRRFGYAKGEIECRDGRKGEFEVWLGRGKATIGTERIEFETD